MTLHPTPTRVALPVWLLDIDGVVNAASHGRPPTHAWPTADWVDTKADGADRPWRILAARPVLDFIRKVHEDGRAEIRWHTTWQELAQNVAEVLDLPAFAVQDAPEYQRSLDHLRRDEWWKLPAVWRVLEIENRRVIWTDDDADWDLTVAQKATLAAAGCLVVSPDPKTGLCKRHLRKIDEWLAVPGAKETTHA